MFGFIVLQLHSYNPVRQKKANCNKWEDQKNVDQGQMNPCLEPFLESHKGKPRLGLTEPSLGEYCLGLDQK